MGEASQDRTLHGWGGVRPGAARVFRPERPDALREIWRDHAHPKGCIARGMGRSYGDAAQNDGGCAADTTRLNRMTGWDPETGVLECEAGATLDEICQTFLPRGYWPAVTPGTRFVSVGGAFAMDVHGKNHHRDGSFSRFVESIELALPSGETMRCSPEENPEVFWATAGGAGLTGAISSLRCKLMRVPSAFVQVDYLRAENLDAALAAMAHNDDDYQYSVAWVDCLAKGANLGRSVLMRGNHAPPDALPPSRRADPFALPRERTRSIPINFPGQLLNSWSVGLFNRLYYGIHKTTEGQLLDFTSYFHPLDRIRHWNRMYGKRGFIQYQATLPPDSVRGLTLLLERLSSSGCASFLAVLKRFGEQGPGLLSHPMPGHTLTLDIPYRPGIESFVRTLDNLLLDHGGRLYLAKDALAAPETIAAMYPRLPEFRETQARLDPEGRMQSTMSRRLRLTAHAEAAHG